MKNCLVLLTKTYPFDKGEEFIENEVPLLSKSFEQVIIIATSTTGQPVQTRATAKNVLVFYIPASKIKKRLPYEAIKLFPFTGYKGYCDEAERKAIQVSSKRKLYLAYFIAKAESVFQYSRKILENCNLNQFEGVTFYSYWLYDTAAAALKLKEYFPLKSTRVVSRAHGYDLYPSRNSFHYLPLRNYILKRIDGVYVCSHNGSDYLKEQYPAYRDKIHTAYLGTIDHGISNFKPDDVLHIVSCCHISPVKRVEILAQALSLLKDSGVKLRWTHFGGGDGLEELKHFASQSLNFMAFHFAGEVKNAELLDFYQNNPVDLFVNTSSSEGLPVSIMEAVSFGIPVLATDVGGTGEIVRENETGFLLDADLTASALAEKLKFFSSLPREERDRLKRNCRCLWQEQFNAICNFTRFACEIAPNKALKPGS